MLFDWARPAPVPGSLLAVEAGPVDAACTALRAELLGAQTS